MTRNFGLDLYRAVAILMVLVWHTSDLLPLTAGGRAVTVFFGFAGVELFFVLSGFLIGGILIREFAEGGSLFRFWRRRWWRTLPNYYLFLTVNFALALFIVGESVNPIAYVVFAQNLAWPIPGFFGESWSLAVEEWYYLLLPLASMAWVKVRRGVMGGVRSQSAVLAGGAILAFGSICLRTYLVTKHPEWTWRFRVRKIALARLDSMFFGIFLAQAKASWPRAWKLAQHPLAGFAGLALAFALFFVESRPPALIKIFVFSGGSIAAALLLPHAWKWQTQKRGSVWLTRAVTFVSLTSYSVYLVNEPLLALMKRVYPPSAEALPAFAYAAVFWTLTFLISAILFREFENRFTRLRR